MTRTRTILLGAAAAVLSVPLGLTAFLNIGPGRLLVENLAARFTGGQVRLTGLHGRFPDALRLDHLEVWDAAGPWLNGDDIAFDWSPTALLRKHVVAQRLSAARLQVPRLPEASPNPAHSSQPFTLPLPIQIDIISLPRLELGAPVAGAAAILAVTGGGRLTSLDDGSLTLGIHRQDQPGDYQFSATLDPARVTATVDLAEPAGGLIAQRATLPDLGPLHLVGAIDGPRQALATHATLTAGPLKAAAHGTIDADHRSLTLDTTADAPAMTPRPDLHWDGAALRAHVSGPFTAPDVKAILNITALQAAGAALAALDAKIEGDTGQLNVHALAHHLTLPAPASTLLEQAPLVIDGTVRLDDPAHPARFSLTHPLLTLTGTVSGAAPTVEAKLMLPDLTPFAHLAHQDVRGHATITVQGTASHFDLTSSATLLPGTPNTIQALLGQEATFRAAIDRDASTFAVTALSLQGQAVTLTGNGHLEDGVTKASLHLNLGRLSALAPQLQGALALDAEIIGPITGLTADITGHGTIATPGVPTGPLTLTAHATGLPGAPAGHMVIDGALAGAPIAVTLDFARDGSGLEAHLQKADWKSVHAEAALHLQPGATLPQGTALLRASRLADLNPLLGQTLQGALSITSALDQQTVRLAVDAHDIGTAAAHATHVTLQARIADPTTRPLVTAALVADGIAAGSTTGNARLDMTGPASALLTHLSSSLRISGTETQVAAAATLDAVKRSLHLASAQATVRGETARLLAPATFDLGGGIAVDRLRLGLRQAVLDVAGRLSPALDATVLLRAPADTLAALAPETAADGQITLDASLKGVASAPSGTIKLAASAIRARGGPGRGLPPATLTAGATLKGGTALLDARLAAGPNSRLVITGRAPLGAGPLDLHGTGVLDLALLDPVLTAAGRQVRGRLTVDGTATGRLSQPALTGTATLADGDLQDFTQGLRISHINGTLRGEGTRVLIQDLMGQAGPGTIGLRGSIGLAADIPLDLTVQLRNAKPLASDRLTAAVDGDVTLRGTMAAPAAGGTIRVSRADIQIPETLPASVAVLDVRRPGQKPRAPTVPTTVALDLTVQAPRAIFVRGRGVDAELGGTLHLGGTSLAPEIAGGFDMRRGTVSVAGTTLIFSRGRVGFDGTGVTGKIDPTLDFTADSTAASTTATLAIGGYASAPKITLSSVPDLPQDEVLAFLLFKRSSKELGPFQLAEIAAALANLTGVGGGVGNPLERVRKGLGLDRLSVGSPSTTLGSTSASAASSAPTIEAGRYVANGVYIGAKQGTTGGQTGATVQIDITKGLKLETDAGTGTGSNAVGLSYQFEY